MNFTYILFDLDGTITDPKLGITNSVLYALEKFGITGHTNDSLTAFIGPPLKESFMKLFGFSEEDAIKGINYYREYFKTQGLYENEPYENIENMLMDLKDSGYTLAIATSKPTPFAKEILKYFKLDQYFEFIGGSNLDNTRTAKAEVIEFVLENLGNPNQGDVIMVGDREHDIKGAKENNLKSVGVLYGYGSKAELESSGADYIAESVESLKAILTA